MPGPWRDVDLVLSGTNARLAPLYNVASALVMPEWNWRKWELAMRINNKDKFKYLGIEDWSKFAASAHVGYDIIDALVRNCDVRPAILRYG